MAIRIERWLFASLRYGTRTLTLENEVNRLGERITTNIITALRVNEINYIYTSLSHLSFAGNTRIKPPISSQLSTIYLTQMITVTMAVFHSASGGQLGPNACNLEAALTCLLI